MADLEHDRRTTSWIREMWRARHPLICSGQLPVTKRPMTLSRVGVGVNRAAGPVSAPEPRAGGSLYEDHFADAAGAIRSCHARLWNSAAEHAVARVSAPARGPWGAGPLGREAQRGRARCVLCCDSTAPAVELNTHRFLSKAERDPLPNCDRTHRGSGVAEVDLSATIERCHLALAEIVNGNSQPHQPHRRAARSYPTDGSIAA
jgi:hypothetical protein